MLITKERYYVKPYSYSQAYKRLNVSSSTWFNLIENPFHVKFREYYAYELLMGKDIVNELK